MILDCRLLDEQLINIYTDPQAPVTLPRGYNSDVLQARITSARSFFDSIRCDVPMHRLVVVAPSLFCVPPSSMAITLYHMLWYLVPFIYLQCEKSGNAEGTAMWKACGIDLQRQILYLDVMLRDGLKCPVTEAIVGKGGAFDLWKLKVPNSGSGSRAVNTLRLSKLVDIHVLYSCAMKLSPANPVHFSGKSIWASLSNKAGPKVPSTGGSGGFSMHFRNVLSVCGLGLLIHDRVDGAAFGVDAQGDELPPRSTMFIDEESFVKLLAILFAIHPLMPMPNALWAHYWSEAQRIL